MKCDNQLIKHNSSNINNNTMDEFTQNISKHKVVYDSSQDYGGKSENLNVRKFSINTNNSKNISKTPSQTYLNDEKNSNKLNQKENKFLKNNLEIGITNDLGKNNFETNYNLNQIITNTNSNNSKSNFALNNDFKDDLSNSNKLQKSTKK